MLWHKMLRAQPSAPPTRVSATLHTLITISGIYTPRRSELRSEQCAYIHNMVAKLRLAGLKQRQRRCNRAYDIQIQIDDGRLSLLLPRAKWHTSKSRPLTHAPTTPG